MFLHVVAVSFGKTTLGIDRCATPQTLTRPVGWFSPTYKMLSEVWREAEQLLAPITTRRNMQDHRLEFATGGVLEFWSLDNPSVARGRKYKRIIIDEAAMVSGLRDAWQYVLRPTLVDLEGDAFFLSTPKGRNDFWQMYQWGQDPLEPEWASWQSSSYENPKIPRHELDALRSTMPERAFSQEILAEFLEDSAVFRKIIEAAVAKPQGYAQDGYPSHPKHSYICGIDWGKYSDYSVFSVVDTTTKELCYLDRSNHIDYTAQIKRLEDICKRFQISQVVAESNAQATTIELIRRAGLPLREFVTTNASKQNIIEGLMLGLEQGKLKILNDPILIGELQAFEATRLPGGGLRYAAPEGYHDDCVMALALAWDAAKDDYPVRVEKRR